jgi:hypothetical protein
MFVAVLLFTPLVFAEVIYFDFTTNPQILAHDGTTTASLEYDLTGLEEALFEVRPQTENGSISIWNQETNQWVYNTGFWQNMPTLKKEMRIKINALASSTTSIYFEIRNKETTKIYKTPSKVVWSSQNHSKYITKLNNNILSQVQENETSKISSSTTETITINKQKPLKILGAGLMWILFAWYCFFVWVRRTRTA